MLVQNKLLHPRRHDRRGPLRHRCELCKKEPLDEDALRCEECRVVRYCSAKHQRWDAEQHSELCSMIKTQRMNLAAEEKCLAQLDSNILVSNRGRLWNIPVATLYMESFKELNMLIHQSATLDGAREALQGLTELLHMSRRDEACVRGVVACRMLQLDQDQECYDFVKWFELRAYDDSKIVYNWHDLRLPYLNPTPSSLLSSVSFLDINRTEPVFLSTILLLKIKLVIDVKNVILVRRLLRHHRFALSSELIDMVSYQVVRSPASTKFVRMDDSQLGQAKDKLSAHVVQIGKAIVRKNAGLTRHFVNHEQAIDDPLQLVPKKIRNDFMEMVMHGQIPIGLNKQHDERVITLSTLYPAFVQTEEAFGLLKKTNAKAKSHNVKPNGMWRFFPSVIDEACDVFPSQTQS